MMQRLQTDQIIRRSVRNKRGSAFFLLIAAGLLSIMLAGCGEFGYSDSEAPRPPSNVRAESDDRLITLEWSRVETQDLAGYNVYRSDTLIADVDSAEKLNSEGLLADTSYNDGEVVNGTTYHYVITAEDDKDNESAPSEEVRRTPFATPPRP